MDILDKMKETRRFNKERNQLIREFSLIMTHTGAYNLKGDTYEIIDEKQTSYGWRFKLFCSRGMTFEKLETLTPYIRDGLKCAYFMYQIHESNKFAICDVIYNEKLTINKKPFEPYPVKPYELYAGNSVNGDPIIININEKPFTFLAGETGSGKNGSLNHMLISLIHNCTPEQVKILYYSGDKGDGGFYENCEHVYAYSESDLEKLYTMLDYILKEEQRRKKMFKSMVTKFKGDNLYHYNKIYKDNQLPYIYLVIDEFLSCTVKSSDSKATKELKNQIADKLENMAQRTRAYGMVYIISHQKPEKALCPSFLKNMSSNRICFGYSDIICSEIVLGSGDTSAFNLPNRRAIFKTRGSKELLFTTDLTGKIKEYLSPHIVSNRSDLFDDIRNQNNDVKRSLNIINQLNKSNTNIIHLDDIVSNQVKKDTVTSKNDKKDDNTTENNKIEDRNKEIKTESKVKSKTKEEMLIEAIKSNPNFVPYNEDEAKLVNMIKLEKEKDK